MLGKLLFIPFALGLAGCNMTGIGGTDKFDCQAPVGIPCESLSGAYANAVADNLPGSKKKTKSKYASNKTKAAPGVVGEAPQTGTPLLSDRTVLRVWVAPWEDGKRFCMTRHIFTPWLIPGIGKSRTPTKRSQRNIAQ